MSHFHQGVYTPINRYKCLTPTVNFLSGFELDVFRKLDANPRIIRWGANNFTVQYYSEVDHRIHKYFLDIYCESQNQNGAVTKYIFEIKPDKQVSPPARPKRMTTKSQQNYNRAILTYRVNMNKWQAAQNFSLSNGMKFMIITESAKYSFNNNQLTKISNEGF